MATKRIDELTAATELTGDDLLPIMDGAATTKKILASVARDYFGAGSQPLDSDLTAIAALTTTAFGRGLLALADAAALRTSAGLGTAATTAATDYATAAQGTTADNAVPKSLVDAKGDLIAATADNTPARLAVGTNGHVLTADSTQSTGIKWAAAGGVDYGMPVYSGGTARYCAPGWTFAGNTWTSHSIGYQQWYYTPIYMEAGRTLDSIGINISTNTAGAKGRIGLYPADASWQPSGSLIYQTTEFAASTAGLVAFTGLATALAAGRYMLIIQSTVNGANYSVRVPTNGAFVMSSAGASIAGATYMIWQKNAANGAFAATADTFWNVDSNQQSYPLVFMRFA